MRKYLLAVLAAGSSSAALASPLTWTISESAGPVSIARSGISSVATRGLTVNAGDVVTTGRGGRAVLVRGTEFMMVAPASQLRMPAEQQATGMTQVIEDFGNVVFMIKKKMTAHFEVRTPYLAAVVKGTTFAVGVSPRGASIQVLEGAVDVATLDGRAHKLVTPGAVAMISAANRSRMTIEDNGKTRVIDSPGGGAPATDPIATAPQPTPDLSGAIVDDRPLEPAITTAIYSPATSLTATTAGLISGTIGGEIARAADVSRTTSEATASASKIVGAASAIVTANGVSADAGERARLKEAEVAAAVQNKLDRERAAQVSAAAASQAADDAARALAEEAQTATTRAAAAANAEQAMRSAATAADDVAKAEADRVAKTIAKSEAEAAASAAATAAQLAAQTAATTQSDDAAQAADKAAKDAAKAADKAAKAAEDAMKAAEDKAAKDAEKAARDKTAETAAKEAEKAAADATKASQDKAAKDAEKVAREAEQAAAKAAEEAAKQQEKAAKDAQKAAEDAAKEAAKIAEQIVKDAGKKAEDAVKLIVGLK